jgi:hypothetical protein
MGSQGRQCGLGGSSGDRVLDRPGFRRRGEYWYHHDTDRSDRC